MSLAVAEGIVGLLLVLCGVFFIFKADVCALKLRQFLRSEVANTLIFSVAGIWFLGHVATLGESDFGDYKVFFFIFFAAIIITALVKIRDFLSVRGAAILLLLSSNELLKAAYLQPKDSRLILVTFVYAMIIVGMILGGWPYEGRYWVDFLFKHQKRAKLFGGAMAGYGTLILTTLFW